MNKDVNRIRWTYLYTKVSAGKGMRMNELTIMIFVDEWHPVT